MAIAVRANLVSRCANGFHQMRIPLSDPSDDEKGRPHADPIEEIEQGAGRRLNAGGKVIPVLGGQPATDATHVKPFFKINRENVRLDHAEFFARPRMMKSAIASTDLRTVIPVCSSVIETPKLRSSSSTSSRTSIESSPRPSPKSGVASPISAGVIGSRRLRTIACLISAFRLSSVVVIKYRTSQQATVHADHLTRN